VAQKIPLSQQNCSTVVVTTTGAAMLEPWCNTNEAPVEDRCRSTRLDTIQQCLQLTTLHTESPQVKIK